MSFYHDSTTISITTYYSYSPIRVHITNRKPLEKSVINNIPSWTLIVVEIKLPFLCIRKSSILWEPELLSSTQIGVRIVNKESLNPQLIDKSWYRTLSARAFHIHCRYQNPSDMSRRQRPFSILYYHGKLNNQTQCTNLSGPHYGQRSNSSSYHHTHCHDQWTCDSANCLIDIVLEDAKDPLDYLIPVPKATPRILWLSLLAASPRHGSRPRPQ